ncbi:hypothetical protein [Actinoalloteichus sp. GBA129-24]|uniref:hypothetical protein n=1 Tax=Actinoalloteichus sp. GBA129-24 TaxID=1612551 RepID=UPI0009509048|nr:hypothetical protein [Actinoalloteichus sp. GBA129-24]APU18752.1 hypothetical protein UA75_03595 [Actinoalloteichus sp. GBA129-24]
MTFRDPADWSVSVPARLSGVEQGESVVVSCNRARQHVLVEGTRKPLKPALAALTVSDARWLLAALRPSGRSMSLPAVGNGLARRRLVAIPGAWYVELSIHGETQVLGRWRIHADQVPEAGFALAESIALIRADAPLTHGRPTDSMVQGGSIADLSSASDGPVATTRQRGSLPVLTGPVGVVSEKPVIGSPAVDSVGFEVSAAGNGGGR